MRQVGKYQLIRKLAVGGMAEVYLAKAAGPRGFEKTLVVKCILPHLAQEPAFVEMFLSEAMLAARLTHPHIVQIFDFGEADGSYFLAMEYVDGPSLRTLIKRASAQHLPLPPAVCARLISQACEGLAFAHDFVDPGTGEALGLIHRDVSPDNILLSLQGAVKVVDFGIAKATGQSHRTRSGVIKGKLSYMPPEQLRAKQLDRRVDVYALGVVLYELLTSHKPYSAASDAALMHTLLFDEPVPAVHYRPDLPDTLQRILARAIAKDREQRYPDCHALQADLEDFILAGGRSVTAPQVAQLIQRVTSATGLPALSPAAAAAPGPSRLASSSRTDLDTVSHASPGASGSLATLSEHMLAPQDVSLPAQPSASGLVETRARTRTRLRPEVSAWKRHALVGGMLLVAGGGLAQWQRSTPRENSGPPLVASAEPSAPPPSAPPPPALEQAPAVVEPPAEPVARPPAPRERARSVKSKRPALAAMGTLDVRAHPFADVSVDGTPRGTTPWDGPLALPVGTYTVTLFSPTLSKTVIRRVEVKPGKTTPLTVSFVQEE
ncbi:serine/threonine-protein kinase [Cystobacter fuscus]|nr:serine/threonine-protein kinase [Cystobacter fuscus]